MKTKIGINGLGRIGRMVVRSIFEEKHSNLKIQHINNRADIDLLLNQPGKLLISVWLKDETFLCKVYVKKTNIFRCYFAPYPTLSTTR